MKAVLVSVLCLLGWCAPVWAQSLSVYSDLAQIDEMGKVTAPETLREILSPAIVRNGFTSFQLVVEAPADAKWWLYVGQNPENSVKVTMYRESPAPLLPVDLPYASSGTQVFWMDLWTDGTAPVQRIKVEPELYINNDWATYPIEARVMDARIPQGPAAAAGLRNAGLRNYVCDTPAKESAVSSPGPSLEGLRFRNREQDLRLMDAHAGSKEDVKKRLGGCDAPLPADPEWYLRIRDYLFRLR